MIDVMLHKTQDGKIIFAAFNTRINGNEQRAKHYVYQRASGFTHVTRYLIPKDEVWEYPEYAIGLNVSERIFFGKVRLVELVENHLPETWMALGDIVKHFINK